MSLTTHPAFQAILAAVEAEGRKAGDALRIERLQIQRRYRKRLAFMVAAGTETLDDYLFGLRTPTDERNVRIVSRYFNRFFPVKTRIAA